MQNSTVPGYVSWMRMIQRCTNPKVDSYPRYGGRGITVCERWRKFSNFIADMGERPPGMSIDRFPDSNGNYEPGNCRWATAKEQALNRSSNRLITYKGENKPIAYFAERAGFNPKRIVQRLNAGWTVEDALETPLDGRKIRLSKSHVAAIKISAIIPATNDA